jgi:hypothetical protein
VPSLWFTYKGEEGRTLGKGCGIKWGTIRNTLGKQIGNPKNSRNTIANRTKTYWKLDGKTKIKKFPPPPQGKNMNLFRYTYIHWLHAYFVPKQGCDHFFATTNTPCTYLYWGHMLSIWCVFVHVICWICFSCFCSSHMLDLFFMFFVQVIH